jgi:hypothetical protein
MAARPTSVTFVRSFVPTARSWPSTTTTSARAPTALSRLPSGTRKRHERLGPRLLTRRECIDPWASSPEAGHFSPMHARTSSRSKIREYLPNASACETSKTPLLSVLEVLAAPPSRLGILSHPRAVGVVQPPAWDLPPGKHHRLIGSCRCFSRRRRASTALAPLARIECRLSNRFKCRKSGRFAIFCYAIYFYIVSAE